MSAHKVIAQGWQELAIQHQATMATQQSVCVGLWVTRSRQIIHHKCLISLKVETTCPLLMLAHSFDDAAATVWTLAAQSTGLRSNTWIGCLHAHHEIQMTSTRAFTSSVAAAMDGN